VKGEHCRISPQRRIDPVDTDKIVGGSKLLGEMRDLIRRKHYSIRTEQAYFDWSKRYILFNGKLHPNEIGEAQIVAFLNHLAVKRNVATSTQNQALNAPVFLYKRVLCRKDLTLDNITPAKRSERLPTVFYRGEIARLSPTLTAHQSLSPPFCTEPACVCWKDCGCASTTSDSSATRSSCATVQELLGRKVVRTTMIYTHVMNKGPMGVKSPLTRLTGF
jgi:hypothetical protein